MTYTIARNGRVFGPYSAEEVRRYLGTGNIQPGDLAQALGAEEWLPVGVLFPPEAAPAVAYPGGLPRLFPDPPDLPWWAVLLIGIFTGGLFFVVWGIVQSAWLRRVDAASTAVWFFVADAAVYALRVPSIVHDVLHNLYLTPMYEEPHARLLKWAGFALFLLTRFVFRSELLRHFNRAEPIGLRLNAFLTLIFGSLYFQWHFNRINEVKRALGVARG